MENDVFLPDDTGIDLLPTDPEVTVTTISKKTYAVIAYSGNMNEELMDKKNAKLVEELDHLTSIKIIGKPLVAQYDQPFSIPIFKKDESWIEVVYSKNN